MPGPGLWLRYKSIEKINKINEGDNEEREGTNNLCDIIAKAKLAQINKCQNKLFGNEAKIKREYFLDEKSQNKIIKNFIKENLEFKQAIARYKENISCDEINSEIEFNLDSTKIYVYNPEKSAERICDLLSFRALLEFLNSITKIKFFNANLNHVEVVNNLIKLFEEYNEKPEEFYNLNLNEKYSENIKNMVTRKVSDFIKNYIDGKLNVIVDRLEKN
uniref:Uncharacterized protein n=1 Tax=Meloidogyne hapla TaxID=6305 RepID=A0A1I8B7L6_MELHA